MAWSEGADIGLYPRLISDREKLIDDEVEEFFPVCRAAAWELKDIVLEPGV